MEKKIYTYADYRQWYGDDRFEMIAGEVYDMSPMPSRQHQEINGELSRQIANHLIRHLCSVYAAPFDVRLAEAHESDEETSTVVQPDISVICDPGKLDARGCLGPPDWIIEIASPGTSKKDRKEKFEVYEFAGVKEYWMVFPREQYLLVYYLNEEGKYIGLPPFHQEDRVRSVLFPGLVIDLNDIFPSLDLVEEPWEEDYVRM